jgi:hypothetical protein
MHNMMDNHIEYWLHNRCYITGLSSVVVFFVVHELLGGRPGYCRTGCHEARAITPKLHAGRRHSGTYTIMNVCMSAAGLVWQGSGRRCMMHLGMRDKQRASCQEASSMLRVGSM